MSGRNNNGREPAPTTISPRELQDVLDCPLSNVSYHVRVLLGDKAAALVATKQVRGSVQHFYRPTEALSEDPWVTAILRQKRGS